MGNHINQLLLIIIGWALCLSGCSVVNDAQSRQQQAMQFYQNQQIQEDEPEHPPPVQAEIHCPDQRRDDCGLLVTLNGQNENVDLNVQVHIEEGISFLSDYTEAVVLDENGMESRVTRVSLTPQESRKILFPYQMNGPVLPGAYRVEVIASKDKTLELFGSTDTLIFIFLDDEGEYHFLSTQAEYDQHFLLGFRDGLHGVSYKILLEPKDKPRRGTILVRVNSTEDNYAPKFELESTGGISFVPDQLGRNQVLNFGTKVSREFPTMHENGTRLASFPFIFDKNGQVLEGVYAFKMILDPGTSKARGESAPVAIKIVSDPAYREDRWLTATHVDPYMIDISGVGPMVLDTVPPADREIAQQQCESTWNNANFPLFSDKPEWNFEMSDFNGTLCQLFLQRYAGKVLLTWSEFSVIAIQKNDNISSAKELLQDHEIYLMPKPAGIP